MSRGLGKIQRTIIEVLQAHNGTCGLRELVSAVYYPYDSATHQSVSHYSGLYSDIPTRDRPAYVATWRAVQTLKRRGIVQTTTVEVGPLFADFLPSRERRWIKVELAAELRLSETTLIVRNDGWIDPRRLMIASDWRDWAEREGYRLLEDTPSELVRIGVEVWVRKRRSEPYLVYTPALLGRLAPSLDICPSRAAVEQVITVIERLLLQGQSPAHEPPAYEDTL
jgi:hypothetical protein